MLLPDVNVLVYAFRQDTDAHDRHAAWLDGVVNGDEAYGLADLVLSSFLRIVTHRKIFTVPSEPAKAIAFAEQIRNRPHCARIAPGPRHWAIFTRLCRDADARGNLIPDAYLAALAIESGSEWVTADRDFARFPGLRYRHLPQDF